MQALIEFFPVLAFFATYTITKNMFVATGVLLAATVVQVAVQWVRTRSVNRMALASAGLALVFGGITIVLHDARFIMWKFSVLWALMAAAFLGTQLFTERPLVQRMMGSQLRAEPRVWKSANLMWVAFCIALALANYVFIHGFTNSADGSTEQKSWESAWATWKLASIGVMLVFVFLQAWWLMSRSEPVDAPPAANDDAPPPDTTAPARAAAPRSES